MVCHLFFVVLSSRLSLTRATVISRGPPCREGYEAVDQFLDQPVSVGAIAVVLHRMEQEVYAIGAYSIGMMTFVCWERE